MSSCGFAYRILMHVLGRTDDRQLLRSWASASVSSHSRPPGVQMCTWNPPPACSRVNQPVVGPISTSTVVQRWGLRSGCSRCFSNSSLSQRFGRKAATGDCRRQSPILRHNCRFSLGVMPPHLLLGFGGTRLYCSSRSVYQIR